MEHRDHEKKLQKEARFARDGLRPFYFDSVEAECKSDAIAKRRSDKERLWF